MRVKTPGAQGMQPFWADTTVIPNAHNARRPEKEGKTPGAQGMRPFWADTTVIRNAHNARRPEKEGGNAWGARDAAVLDRHNGYTHNPDGLKRLGYN